MFSHLFIQIIKPMVKAYGSVPIYCVVEDSLQYALPEVEALHQS